MKGIKNDKHVCKLVTDLEQVECYKKWLEYYNDKTIREELDRHAAVRKWAGKKKYGITYFGIHLIPLLLSSIYPDNFHMCCGIVKMVLICLRETVNKTSAKIKEEFAKELLKFWNTWQVSMWENNKTFNHFTRKQYSKFFD